MIEQYTVVSLLMDKATELTGLRRADLVGPSHAYSISHPRQAIMLVAHERGIGQTEIGRKLGGRDHTTVLHGIRAARARYETDSAARALITALRIAVPERVAYSTKLLGCPCCGRAPEPEYDITAPANVI